MLQQMWLHSPFSFTRFVACLPPVLSLKDIIGSSIKKTRKVYTAAQPRGTLACALTRSGSIFIVLFSREKERESSPAPYRAQHAAQCLPARTAQAQQPQPSCSFTSLQIPTLERRGSGTLTEHRQLSNFSFSERTVKIFPKQRIFILCCSA